ncbi:MAG: methyltransferase domain-containing protein, partial [Pseudomonadota bacterium]
MNAFRDHFSDLAALYARARPDYPAALYAWLSEKAPGRALAVDVGCGSGQATHGLAPHFDQVIGTDASGEQIDRAQPAGPVRFEVAPAEACPVDDGTVDLLTAAQAAHWFDHDAFQPEAHRVLRPGGLLAFWTYELLRIEPAI